MDPGSSVLAGRQGMSVTREQVEAAMAKLPDADHRLLVWLCTGQTPERYETSTRSVRGRPGTLASSPQLRTSPAR
jgi:hypothetical protein